MGPPGSTVRYNADNQKRDPNQTNYCLLCYIKTHVVILTYHSAEGKRSPDGSYAGDGHRDLRAESGVWESSICDVRDTPRLLYQPVTVTVTVQGMGGRASPLLKILCDSILSSLSLSLKTYGCSRPVEIMMNY